jgi:hypothetical protein
MYELGLVTADEAFKAFETGNLPSKEDSLESQKEFRELKDDGYYQPIIGGPADQLELTKESGKIALQTKQLTQPSGRPSGSKRKQSTKKVKPIGANYSGSKIQENFILASKVEEAVNTQLLKKFKLKKLNAAQIDVSKGILDCVVQNEEPEKWLKSVANYIENPSDTNEERVEEIRELAIEHGIEPYVAAILYASRND